MSQQIVSYRSAVIVAVLGLGACSPEPKAATSAPASTTASTPASTPASASVPAIAVAAAPAASPGPAALAVDGEGLRLFDPKTGAASPIAFGRPKSEVIDIVERLRGPAEQGTNEDCGEGPVDYAMWPDGLSLVFDDDRFVGWGLDSRTSGKLATVSGVGPGSTRAQLAAAYADVEVSETTLGTEFEAGALGGVLDGPKTAKTISDMWAGTTCVAR